MKNFNPDTLGVYAALDGKAISAVIVNKDPSSPVALRLNGITGGTYFLRHFGGKAGVAKYQVRLGLLQQTSHLEVNKRWVFEQTTIKLASGANFVVPAYTAVFLKQQV